MGNRAPSKVCVDCQAKQCRRPATQARIHCKRCGGELVWLQQHIQRAKEEGRAREPEAGVGAHAKQCWPLQPPSTIAPWSATQPLAGVWDKVLCSGFLLRGLGRLAAACRWFGGRRGDARWGQRPGLSLTEGAARRRCAQLGGPWPLLAGAPALPACRSAGGLLLSVVEGTPGLAVNGDGVLVGWGTADKSSVTTLVVPPGVTHIGDYAFDGCRRLTTLRLPEGITHVGNLAFRGCVGLTTLHFPKGITHIGNNAFRFCHGLTSVEVPRGAELAPTAIDSSVVVIRR